MIRKANRKDCRKAVLTEKETISRFKPTNLIKNPTIAAVPDKDKNKEIKKSPNPSQLVIVGSTIRKIKIKAAQQIAVVIAMIDK